MYTFKFVYKSFTFCSVYGKTSNIRNKMDSVKPKGVVIMFIVNDVFSS